MSIQNLRYSVVLLYFRLFEINSATIIDCVLVCRLLIIIIIITIIIGQPECPVGGRRRHAASKIACIVLSSVRSRRSSICPGRLSTAWLVSIFVFFSSYGLHVVTREVHRDLESRTCLSSYHERRWSQWCMAWCFV